MLQHLGLWQWWSRWRDSREQFLVPSQFIHILQHTLHLVADSGFCYVVFNSHMFNATDVQLWKLCLHIKFLLFIRPIHAWHSRTPAGVRCAHFPSVYTTRMDQYSCYKTVELTWVVILLRDIQLTHVQCSEVQLWKRCILKFFFTLNDANTCVALPNAWRRSVRALS
jgi:hypothetical protein